MTILATVLKKWNASPDKTPATAILLTAKACVSAKKATSDPTYTGSAIPDHISKSTLDIYCAMRAKAGVPLSDNVIDRALFPEYATNMSWSNGTLNLVTTKYVGMEVLPGTETIMDDAPSPSDALIDFLFNVLRLKLCTVKDIQEFVNQDVFRRAKAYLLSDDDVRTLVAQGIHERFDDEAIADSMMVVQECEKTMRALFPSAGTE
jgi:hypothetical protein